MTAADETKPVPEAGSQDEPQAESQAEARLPSGYEPSLPDDSPRIELPLFEGPLDLLLYLIRKHEFDLHDIPIAPITRQYMEYLDVMQEVNLDVAGDFMVMAATLIHIKAKMLVPVDPTEAQGEDAEDPREGLVQRLLEFQRYKEAAGVLHQKGQIRAATWTRPEGAVPTFDDSGEEMLEAGLFDLISAFKEVLDRRKVLLAHSIEAPGKSLEQRIDELMEIIREGASVEFLELFYAQETKADMIVTFLALLELIRLKRVKVYQRGMFGRHPRVPAGRARARRHAASRSYGRKMSSEGLERRRNPGPAAPAGARHPRGADLRRRAAAAAEADHAVLGGVPADEWREALAEIRADYARDDRGLQVVDVAGGLQITTRPEYNDWIRELIDPKVPTRLSIQALETLAVIAYKQPVTLPEIIELRGIKSGGVLKTLLEKRLIRITGRKEVVGRPILYGTTREFLLHFGLKDLTELPAIEEFAEVLGEEVDVAGLKRAIEAPTQAEAGELVDDSESEAQGGLAFDNPPDNPSEDPK